MIVSLFERWIIASCVERGRPFPGWLSRRLDRFPDLRRYADSLRRLDSALSDPAGFPTAVHSRALQTRIAEAVAHSPGPSARRSPPSWLAGSLVAAALVVAAAFALRFVSAPAPSHTVADPRGRAAPLTLPPDLRRSPVVALASSVERPLAQQWHTITAQTRQTLSGFIRSMPGLPVGAQSPPATQ